MKANTVINDSPFDNRQVLSFYRTVSMDERKAAGLAAAMAALVSWAPLVLLCFLQGGVLRSFLTEIGAYGRFIIALPLLLISPLAMRSRLTMVVRRFRETGLVKDRDLDDYQQIVLSSRKLRDSGLVAIVILILTYAQALLFVLTVVPSLPASWRTASDGAVPHLSWAGWWWVLISQPLFAYLLLQFLYRVALWWRYLWKASKLGLDLRASHPDQAGGLAFLGLSLPAFTLPTLAIAASTAGVLADLIIGMHVSIASYKYVIAVFAVLLVALFTAPLFFFVRELSNTKNEGMLAYGALVGEQLRQFEAKWIRKSVETGTSALDAPDFSTIADSSAIVAAVHKMNVVPFGWGNMLPLLLAALLPFLPVVALQIPVKDLVIRLLKLVML